MTLTVERLGCPACLKPMRMQSANPHWFECVEDDCGRCVAPRTPTRAELIAQYSVEYADYFLKGQRTLDGW